LSPEEAASGKCIKCHVTGTPEMIAAEGAKPSLPGVQCESCHGAGRAHVEAAKAGDASNARTKPIAEQTCVDCHNETSPHYKPFFYGAMKGLVHRKG
jgi:formate-dependent nitrite reductase cytochrome c552 subunit